MQESPRGASGKLPLSLSSSGKVPSVTRPRALSKRTTSGAMTFVHLLCKGDLRQWFEKLEPKDGVLSPAAVREFALGFCRATSLECPVDEVSRLLEDIQEFKFFEFVQLALLLSKPLRAMGRLELDEELQEDGQESTSEASGSEPEDSDGEDDDDDDKGKPAKATTPVKSESPSRAPRSPRSTRSPRSSGQQPVLQRVQSRLRAGSVRKDGLLQYVNFVTRRDAEDWFSQVASVSTGSVAPASVRSFFENLAGVLRLKDWRQPLESTLAALEGQELRLPEFLQLFLALSRASREARDLKIDDTLAEEEEESTSEGGEEDGPPPPAAAATSKAAPDAKGKLAPPSTPPRRRQLSVAEEAWCPPFVEGQRKTVLDLSPEVVSAVLSFLSVKDLVRCLTVCKAWVKAVQRFPPHQWTFAKLYHNPTDLAAFKRRHRLLRSLTFMRQFNSELVEPVLRQFPALSHLSLTIHACPKFVGELSELQSLQCEGRIPPTLLKHLAVACHRSLTSLNLSRDFTLTDEERMVPGMANIKEFAKLRELSLQGCKGDGLNYILQNCAMIRHLNLGFMAISNIHCQLIGGNMFHLRSLVLRSTDVTDDGLYEIGLGCKKLEQAFLENCKRIGAQGVVDLIANCTQLTALKLAGCSHLKDDTVFALSGARNLRELDVQMLELVTPKAWGVLATKCVHIRIFHAWGCQITEDVLAKFHRRAIIYHSLTARTKRAPVIIIV